MIIKGLECIDHSPILQLLFDRVKDWMDVVTRSTEEGESVERTLRILPKTIGRNHGFVVDVLSSTQTIITTFYAKVQRVSMDTVLIHHVLKEMKCGPDVFHIPILELSGRLYHGVITRKVVDWRMVNSLTPGERMELFGERDRLLSATFLLNVLIELGRFGNIPNNGDNWGFIDSNNYSVSGLSLVDFSRGGPARKRFQNEKTFRKCWRENLHHLFEKWETYCEPSYYDEVALNKYIRREDAISDQADLLPFLCSPQAFAALLQSACDATAMWLHDTISHARCNVVYIGDTKLVPSPTPLSTLSLSTILQPFRCVLRPNTEGLSYEYQATVREYLQLVNEWNDALRAMCGWFPFPMNSNNARYGFGRYALSCHSMVANACEGDVAEETEWNEQFVPYAPAIETYSTAPAHATIDMGVDEDLLYDLMSPYTSMMKVLREEDVTVFSPSYVITRGSAPYYEERICCVDSLSRVRSLSMEVNVCDGDVGKETENAKFVTTTPKMVPDVSAEHTLHLVSSYGARTAVAAPDIDERKFDVITGKRTNRKRRNRNRNKNKRRRTNKKKSRK